MCEREIELDSMITFKCVASSKRAIEFRYPRKSERHVLSYLAIPRMLPSINESST